MNADFHSDSVDANPPAPLAFMPQLCDEPTEDAPSSTKDQIVVPHIASEFRVIEVTETRVRAVIVRSCPAHGESEHVVLQGEAEPRPEAEPARPSQLSLVPIGAEKAAVIAVVAALLFATAAARRRPPAALGARGPSALGAREN